MNFGGIGHIEGWIAEQRKREGLETGIYLVHGH